MLFDLERRETIRAREEELGRNLGAPDRVPPRVPSSGVVVSIANLNEPSAKYVVPVALNNPRRILPGKWRCFR